MQIQRETVLADRYRIEHCLGRGGMGSVWRAVDLRLDRPVAIKLASGSVNSSTSPGQARRRLRREAEALAALSEPRIARVYDFVEVGEDVCLVMELVDGESLAARLDRWPRLTVAEALEITEQCAQALHAAHRIGIVHRDVKPSNIMLGSDGVKVVDFGIAAHTGPDRADTTATMARTVVGTAAYLAPERALGSPAQGAADFYSLGVVLYQMLAGHLPFRSNEPLAMIYAHTSTAPEPLPADVPEPAAKLCMRMLEKSPERRATSVHEISAARAALNAWLPEKVSAAAAVTLRAQPLPPGMRRGPRGRIGGLHDRRAVRRGTALVAALSSTAALLAATTAWLLLDQPAPAGAATSIPSASAPAAPMVTLSPSSRHSTASSPTGASSTGASSSTGHVTVLPTEPVSHKAAKAAPPQTSTASDSQGQQSSPGGKHGKHGGHGGPGGGG